MDNIQITQAIRDLLEENIAYKNPLSILLNVNMKFREPHSPTNNEPYLELELRDGEIFNLELKEYR